MSEQCAPLLDVFFALRVRNFPLGVQEYLLTLEALEHGFGVGSREDLIVLCQTLWAKTLQEQAQVREVLQLVLPQQIDVESLKQRADGVEAGLESEPERTSARPEEDNDGGRTVPDVAGTGESQEWEGGGVFAIAREMSGTSADMAHFTEHAWRLDSHLDFVGSLPVTRRQMKRAWRYYRRMRRIGPPIEFDVDATIEQMHRYGVLLKPVFVPRRSNLARVLILQDKGGSMIPFRRITEPLLDTARHSGLAKVSVYYFHNVPTARLFSDPSFLEGELLEEALAPFADAGLLIVSDAGAARGNKVPERVAHTVRFLETVERYTPNAAWLNPTPPERWPGTSANAIQQRSSIPMFTLTRAGLDAAVAVLRGQTNVA